MLLCSRVWLNQCTQLRDSGGQFKIVEPRQPPSFTGVDDTLSVISVQMGRGVPEQAECDVSTTAIWHRSTPWSCCPGSGSCVRTSPCTTPPMSPLQKRWGARC